MGKPHALLIPYPAQGHVIPLMELSYHLVERGFDITFVNTEFNHARVMAALPVTGDKDSLIQLVAIPDGMGEGEDRNELGKLTEAMLTTMPGHLEELIGKINRSSDTNDITCIIADFSMGWALDVARKMRIRRAAFWPAAAGLVAVILHIPRLIEAGIINDNGFSTKQQMIRLSQTMAAMNTDHLVWRCIGDPMEQQIIFRRIFENNQSVKTVDWILANSFHELDPSAYTLVPKLLHIGPLLLGNRVGQPAGNFWQEDSTCLTWLDQQPVHSVIYIAFGSFTVFDQSQFHELSLGLELLGRPFLWVVRPDLTDGKTEPYPNGFQKRVAAKGRMVGWSPQQKVLAHRSIACFLTHCGWNSTIEGISMGVPFLCWPYFADQFLNQNYICDVWKVGLRLIPDGNGIISRGEIKKKVEELLVDEGIRTRALELKDVARKSVSVGGSSLKNFNDFVEAMK